MSLKNSSKDTAYVKYYNGSSWVTASIADDQIRSNFKVAVVNNVPYVFLNGGYVGKIEGTTITKLNTTAISPSVAGNVHLRGFSGKLYLSYQDSYDQHLIVDQISLSDGSVVNSFSMFIDKTVQGYSYLNGTPTIVYDTSTGCIYGSVFGATTNTMFVTQVE